MPTYYGYHDTPLGKIMIACRNKAIVGLWFEGQKYEGKPESDWQSLPTNSLLKKAFTQIDQYFAKNLTEFDLPLELGGTDFQAAVWKELLNIPSGVTITYGELANRLGRPTAVRAAAAAVGRNPASIVVPCHRVLGANGSLTGYAGGIQRKEQLLTLENR